MENKKKTHGEYIKIHTDGRNTIAQLYDGNTFQKCLGEAVARCHPDDEFDLATGAKLALDRLLVSGEMNGEFIGFRGLSKDPNHLRLVGGWAKNISARSVAYLFGFLETWKNIATIAEEESSGNFLQHFWTPTKNQNMILARKKGFYHFCVFCIGRLKREKKKQKWRIKNEAM